MDTRNKLLSAPEAHALAHRLRREGKHCKVVAGYFDPLLAAHARRLNEAREPGALLAVIVTDPPSPILPAPARAEMVAALAAVDYVVLPGEASPGTLFDGLEILHGEAADLELTEKLIQHVHNRQRTS